MTPEAWENRCPCGRLYHRGEACSEHPDGLRIPWISGAPAGPIRSYWPGLLTPQYAPEDAAARWTAAMEPLRACLAEAGYPAVYTRQNVVGLGFTLRFPPAEVLLTAAGLCGVLDLVEVLAL